MSGSGSAAAAAALAANTAADADILALYKSACRTRCGVELRAVRDFESTHSKVRIDWLADFDSLIDAFVEQASLEQAVSSAEPPQMVRLAPETISEILMEDLTHPLLQHYCLARLHATLGPAVASRLASSMPDQLFAAAATAFNRSSRFTASGLLDVGAPLETETVQVPGRMPEDQHEIIMAAPSVAACYVASTLLYCGDYHWHLVKQHYESQQPDHQANNSQVDWDPSAAAGMCRADKVDRVCRFLAQQARLAPRAFVTTAVAYFIKVDSAWVVEYALSLQVPKLCALMQLIECRNRCKATGVPVEVGRGVLAYDQDIRSSSLYTNADVADEYLASAAEVRREEAAARRAAAKQRTESLLKERAEELRDSLYSKCPDAIDATAYMRALHGGNPFALPAGGILDASYDMSNTFAVLTGEEDDKLIAVQQKALEEECGGEVAVPYWNAGSTARFMFSKRDQLFDEHFAYLLSRGVFRSEQESLSALQSVKSLMTKSVWEERVLSHYGVPPLVGQDIKEPSGLRAALGPRPLWHRVFRVCNPLCAVRSRHVKNIVRQQAW